MVKPPLPRLQRGKHIAHGLVGCWQFYEGSGSSVHDISGNDNHGNDYVTQLQWKGGPDGSCVEFDGVNASLQMSDKDMPAGTSQRSYMFWFKPSTASGTKVYLSYATQLAGKQISIYYLDSLTMSLATSGHAWGFNWTSNINWNHFAATYPDGQTQTDQFKLYFNGVQQNAYTTGGSVQTLNTTLGGTIYVGSNHGNTARYAYSYDDLRIYNRELSANEIKQIYAGHG